MHISTADNTRLCIDQAAVPRVLLVNSPVTDDDRSVVRCGSKQGVKSVIGHAPHCLLMVSVDKKLSKPLIRSITSLHFI